MPKLKTTPHWLENLQANSWQVEMFIAGGVVITLYQLPDYFRRYFILAYETVGLNDYIILLLLSVYLITRLLLIGFIANLILRSIWVAYIGIYASFPSGINRFPDNFKEWYKRKESLQPEIKFKLDRLERACNISFSLAILLCLISVSVIILMLIILLGINQIPFYSFLDTAKFKYGIIIFCVLLVLGVFERYTFWLLKNRPNALRRSERIYRFFDYLTLSFLYKGAWLTLVSNMKAWKIQSLVVGYFFLGLVLSVNQIGNYLKSNGFFHYDILDQRAYRNVPTTYNVNYNYYYNRIPEKKSFSLSGCISQDIIKDRHMWVFVSYWKSMDKALGIHLKNNAVPLTYNEIEALEGETNWEKRVQTDSLYKDALADFIMLQINGKKLQQVKWYKTQLEKTAEHGFIAYIDTDSLSVGNHLLEVRLNNFNWKNEPYVANWLNIPFWKE